MYQPTPKTSNTFIVGTAAGYAPFVSINEQGEYEGFDIDVANALAKQMNKTLIIKDLGSMTSLFVALEQGKIDAIIWGLSIIPERLQKVAMIRYQGEKTTTYPLLFWNAIPEGINSITDMTGMRVCVEPTSSQESALNAYPFITKIPIEHVDDALLSIQYGKADAALVEPAIAKKFMNKYPEIKKIDMQLPEKDQVLGIGIAVKKNNVSLQEKIELGIDALTGDGTLALLEKKWDIA
jgi:polar amino acid transport system substrate-binding protein